ncbi:hypothetical protein BJX61DRAFT_541589 [Aspergillus egyptiacus]|nr:hypothetical protein BJX61DRAFT_541589 [Aspergillus egyptiacus]
MPNTQENNHTATSAPPPPPPPPPSSKISPYVLKIKSTPPEAFFPSKKPRPATDLPAPTGPYFFYGTLSDPDMLRDVLSLGSGETPQLRPARIEGYKVKLWGQYPAILDSGADSDADSPGSAVHGAVYRVQTVEHAERLARYETDSYCAVPCWVRYCDGEEEGEEGYVFKFVGDVRDLTEREFDLGSWLRRVKRVVD